jgi:hypothetical protein
MSLPAASSLWPSLLRCVNSGKPEPESAMARDVFSTPNFAIFWIVWFNVTVTIRRGPEVVEAERGPDEEDHENKEIRRRMSRRTIVQKGEEGSDLFIYCHIDPALVRARVSGRVRDAVVVERWGEGTRTYRPLLETYGGFAAWVAELGAACGKKDGFSRVCLTTWSAGSQVAKEVCKGNDWPDAILMLDGLYGDKPPGSKSSDGNVVFDEGLAAIARYATAAACGQYTMGILHSEIGTPYASSRECAAAVRQKVEEAIGAPLEPDPTVTAETLGAFTEAVSAGNLHIVGFPGVGPAEHVREGQLYDACWRLWLPWASD